MKANLAFIPDQRPEQLATMEPACELAVQPRALLAILNDILRTNCNDIDALDVSATWAVIVAELKPDDDLMRTLALRYQTGMTLAEAGRILGLSLNQVYERCLKAIRKLRHPCRMRRIRNSIMGCPNLYRGGLTTKHTLTRKPLVWLVATAAAISFSARAETASIVIPTNAALRVQFGAEKLAEALKAVGMESITIRSNPPSEASW